MRRYCPVAGTLFLGLMMAVGLPASAQGGSSAAVEFGRTFPTTVYKNLNLAAGPNTFDLASVIGKKPVILCYWIAGNNRSDEMFLALQALADEVGSDKLTLLGVSFPQPGRDAAIIRQKAEELGIDRPVLADEAFKLGQALRVQSVPNVTLIDSEGRLRLTNGASLGQVLEYKMDLEGAIRRMARTGNVGSYGFLPRYYPVNELIGKECPDFEAAWLATAAKQRWHNVLDDEKVNVLIFWSVDCPHCQKTLPELNTWLKTNRDGLNVVSAASISSEATKIKTREFCQSSEFVFPTFVDWNLEISNVYNVTTTPTILIIGPDGVIDSVLLSGEMDLPKAIDEKRRKLLSKSQSS